MNVNLIVINAVAEKHMSRHHLKQIIMGTLFFAAMGWCGTKYPGWWRGPKKPDPEPWWKFAILSAIGIATGLISGLAFSNAIADQTIFAGQGMIASGLVAFGASNIVTGFASAFLESKEVR